MNLKAKLQEILVNGPARVVIDDSGEAWPPGRALRDRNIDWRKGGVVFIRKDGWSLAASPALMELAESLWADEWVGVVVNDGKAFCSVLTYEQHCECVRRAKEKGGDSDG